MIEIIYFSVCTSSKGDLCNVNGAGSSCSNTDCNCESGYEGAQCENCSQGYYVSAGTGGTDPTCSSM